MAAPVAVIDLENFPAELEKLAAAAARQGCFRIVKHGMRPSLEAEMKAVTRSLFEIPAEVKLLNINERIDNGSYVPPTKMGRFFESFSIYDAASLADVHAFCSILQVSEYQREILCECVAELYGVMMNVAGKVAESLGLNGYSFEEWACGARLHLYNFKEEEDIGSIGLPGHTDSNFLTLVIEDDSVGGLEIMNANKDFVAIDPVPGAFLVFVGDAAKAWSNGRMRNAMHRVICKAATPRISIVYYLLAPKDDRIEPEPALIDSDHPKLYQSFMYGEYRKLRNAYHLKTEEMIFPLLKAEEHQVTISTSLSDKLLQSLSNYLH
ncbi:Gibberellin 2-beta-dioxygenase 8 [Platanthera zijinensis]|uniref:Gibberellin 2-beta-dioxygenase 8 n=1 Tax=Platanthera zijinensis TaxID=2320716 RepID=A0AAP0C278_9ASPA